MERGPDEGKGKGVYIVPGALHTNIPRHVYMGERGGRPAGTIASRLADFKSHPPTLWNEAE
jgi:hypothetical protein